MDSPSPLRKRYEATELAAVTNRIFEAPAYKALKECDYDVKMILMCLGFCEPAAAKATVSEIYSPPRVTEELRRRPWTWRSLIPGFALDLTVNDPDDNMPWDFSKSGKRSKAMRLVRENMPYMIIGSPAARERPVLRPRASG